MKTVALSARVLLPAPPLCWIPDPDAPKRCCTNPDPDHAGDHEHEYSGLTWPRYSGEQLRRVDVA